MRGRSLVYLHLLRRRMRVEQFVQPVSFVQSVESVGIISVVVIGVVVVAFKPVEFVTIKPVVFVGLIVIGVVVGVIGVVEQRIFGVVK